MDFLLALWIILCFLFLGVPVVYYLYMKRISSQPWRLAISKNYTPTVTILIPAHNEEKTIRLKLENLSKVNYPKDKMQVLLVNDFSTDKTLEESNDFINSHGNMNMSIINVTEHGGKTKALNHALGHATGDIVVVSDADCFWSSDILANALPYFADPSVAAVTGLEMLLNPKQSWVTETEVTYNDTVHTIRIGESKTHSTIFFQGGFGAYRRSVLDEFDSNADDSGTALNLVQKKGRTLLIPEAVYFTAFPSAWRSKVATKIRRASQLIRIWMKCVGLSWKGELVLPKRISFPEAFLYLVNPVVFVLLVATTLLLTLQYHILFPIFLVALSLIIIAEKTRTLLIEVIQNNLILLAALFASLSGRNFSVWKTAQTARLSITKEMLQKEGLL